MVASYVLTHPVFPLLYISNCAPLVRGFSALTGINSPCVSLPSAKRAVASITVLVVQLPLVSCRL